MNKSDCLWVMLRFFGLYFLAKAIIALPAILVSVLLVFPASNTMGTTAEGTIDQIARTVSNASWTSLVSSMCKFVLFSAIGLYLARQGKFVHRAITPPD